jgi:hypothetical protein
LLLRARFSPFRYLAGTLIDSYAPIIQRIDIGQEFVWLGYGSSAHKRLIMSMVGTLGHCLLNQLVVSILNHHSDKWLC